MTVWPACSFLPSSIRLNFCRSSTVTLYCFAIEVSVSPRATTWVVPLLVWEVSEAVATGVGSPTMTPGFESCCSIFNICCDSASNFVLISSSLFATASFGDGEFSALCPRMFAAENTIKRTQNPNNLMPHLGIGVSASQAGQRLRCDTFSVIFD